MFERGVCGFAVGSALRGLLERAGAERCVGADLCAVPRTVASLAPSACHVDTRLRLASAQQLSRKPQRVPMLSMRRRRRRRTLCVGGRPKSVQKESPTRCSVTSTVYLKHHMTIPHPSTSSEPKDRYKDSQLWPDSTGACEGKPHVRYHSKFTYRQFQRCLTSLRLIWYLLWK